MQNELDKDEYLSLSKKENFLFFSFLVFFTAIWLFLFVNFPKSLAIGYFLFFVFCTFSSISMCSTQKRE